MIGSTYIPARWPDVEAQKIQPNVIGIQGTITKNTVQTIDTIVADDVLIRGIELSCLNSSFGDMVTIKIVDINGVYAPAGTVLSIPVLNYNVPLGQAKSSYESIAPSKMLGGLAIRLIYTSVGQTNDVSIGVNFLFVKILI